MARAIYKALMAVALLLLVGVVFIFLLLYTPPGRALILAQAEAEIVEELGGEAKISAMRGRLPGHIILEDIILSDAGEIWARIDHAELRWRPLRLFIGRIDIVSLAIDGGALFHEPPDIDDDEPFSIPLPEELPSLRIAELTVNNLQSHLGGVSARLDGAGDADMDGKEINARLKLTSAEDADTIDIVVDIAPDADRIYIDATIASQENGVVASLADLGGPLFINIDADSPPDHAEISVNGEIGAYGRIDAMLLADLTAVVSVNAEGVFTAGDRLADIEELSRPVEFGIVLEDADRGGRLTVNRLETAAGTLAGDMNWAGLRDARNNRLAADLRITLADGYRPEVQSYLGNDVTVGVSMQRRPDDYTFELILRGENLEAAISDGVSDLKKIFSGDLVATMAAREDFPTQTAILKTRFNVELDDKASLRAFDLRFGEGFHAEGDADFSFADEQIRIESDVEAAPAFVAGLASGVAPRGPIIARIDAAGAADLFTLNARIDTPDIGLGDNTAPAFIADVALSGLPNLPTGDIKATAKQGAGAFEATLRSSQSGRIAAPTLIYTGRGFNLRGAGAYTPQAQLGEIDLVYNGDDSAEPWPGVFITGAFEAKGGFARDGQHTDLSVTSSRLRVNSSRFDKLALRAVGPPDAIETTLSASRIAVEETVATDISLSALVNPKNELHIRLNEAGAAFEDNTAQLLEPGEVTVADGVTLDNIRLGWSQHGRIAIDGAFSKSRWRGDLDFVDVNIPQTDGRATLKLTLDTDDAGRPAAGAFTLKSLISNEEATISGDISWDGEALLLTSLPDTDALHMRLALPAKLIRQPQLRISGDGELDGYIRYDGAIEPFAAFMPPEMQTLEGFLAVNFDVSGTMENPSLAGVAEITDGAYTELRSGLSIAGLHTRAEADVSANGSYIAFSGGARGGGQTGEDTINIGGAMTLADISRLDLKIDLNNAALSAHPVNTVRADGTVTIAGALDAIAASGDISLHELDAEIVTPESTGLVPIEVVNIDDASATADLTEAAKPSALTYDINIDADDRIFIRGRGVDSEWSADINIASVKDQPVIIGSMNLRRGTIDFSGRRFTIDSGRITFDRLSPNNPLLNIRATFETSDVTATIDITGRAQDPNIELNATPDLPDEDIMALILFGKPADELTAFESLQTAQALASLGGIGPFGGTGVTGSIRRATGLDMLNFDIDPESGGGSLTVGKYVADGLFVSATQDAQGKDGAVIIEYEITDNISVETEVRQDGDQTVSANWKKDF